MKRKLQEVLTREERVFAQKCIPALRHLLHHSLTSDEMSSRKSNIPGAAVMVEIDDRDPTARLEHLP